MQHCCASDGRLRYVPVMDCGRRHDCEAIQTQADCGICRSGACGNFNVMAEFADFDPHRSAGYFSAVFNGYHWCSEIRKLSKVPIIFISSASDNLNMVMAMNLGADDFIAKPLTRDVLMAKLQALLRRTMILARRSRCWSTGARFWVPETDADLSGRENPAVQK